VPTAATFSFSFLWHNNYLTATYLCKLSIYVKTKCNVYTVYILLEGAAGQRKENQKVKWKQDRAVLVLLNAHTMPLSPNFSPGQYENTILREGSKEQKRLQITFCFVI
jgi:hypothetical protein